MGVIRILEVIRWGMGIKILGTSCFRPL